jgi:hypothetical protein
MADNRGNLKRGRNGGGWGSRKAVLQKKYRERTSKKTTVDALLVESVELVLSEAMGGDPSPQEIILIQRIAVKCLKIHKLEHNFINKGQMSKDYLSWTQSLRLDLTALGLKRVPVGEESLVSFLRDYNETKNKKGAKPN